MIDYMWVGVGVMYMMLAFRRRRRFLVMFEVQWPDWVRTSVLCFGALLASFGLIPELRTSHYAMLLLGLGIVGFLLAVAIAGVRMTRRLLHRTDDEAIRLKDHVSRRP